MQTWVALGGFDFSNPGSPNHQTWKLMTARNDWRAQFIRSLAEFMDHYGFQGVDLDWEYPSAGDRGGSINDAANYVALLREMRSAWGTKYGISAALPSSSVYLGGFDVKGMETYVDFFSFSSYDVDGPKDAGVIHPHTDIRDIQNNTTTPWATHLDAKKLNFGLAYYGRGYTLTDPKCANSGCKSAGASKPGPCTNSAGIMSNVEIHDLVKQKGLKPQMVPNTMSKQITWDDQWMGYDDDETMNLKINWAAQNCFGGTAMWSVDMASGEGRWVDP